MNIKNSNISPQTLAVIHRNLTKPFKQGNVNDDRTFDPTHLSIESAMTLMDHRWGTDEGYRSIRQILKSLIQSHIDQRSGKKYKGKEIGLTSSEMWTYAGAKASQLLGRELKKSYGDPAVPRMSPEDQEVYYAQKTVNSFEKRRAQYQKQLKGLKEGSSEYIRIKILLDDLDEEVKNSENPARLLKKEQYYGSQDMDTSGPNETREQRQKRLYNEFDSLTDKLTSVQTGILNLKGRIQNGVDRIKRLYSLRESGKATKATEDELKAMLARLDQLTKNLFSSLSIANEQVKRYKVVSKAVNEYVQDEKRKQIDLGFGWRTLEDVGGLFSGIEALILKGDPKKLQEKWDRVRYDHSMLSTYVASMPRLLLRGASNKISQFYLGEDIDPSVYSDSGVRLSQQIAEMIPYFIPYVGPVLGIASLDSLERSFEKDPAGTWRSVADSVNLLSGKVIDPETGETRDALLEDQLIRCINIVMLADGALRLKGNVNLEGLASALHEKFPIQMSDATKFINTLDLQLKARGIDALATKALAAEAKRRGFSSVKEFLKKFPRALRDLKGQIAKSPDMVGNLGLVKEVTALLKDKGNVKKIQTAKGKNSNKVGKSGSNQGHGPWQGPDQGATNSIGFGKGSDSGIQGGNGKSPSGLGKSNGWTNSTGNNGDIGGFGSKKSSTVGPVLPTSPTFQGPKVGGGVAVAEKAGATTTQVQGPIGSGSNKSAGSPAAENQWTVDGSSSNSKSQGLREGYTWFEENPIDNPSVFDLPQPNGQPSGIKLELGPEGHRFTLSDGSGINLKKPYWKRFIKERPTAFGSNFGLSVPNGIVGHPQSFSFGLPSDTRRFSELGDPTKSGSGSGQPAAAGGTSANGQAGTAVQPQANSGELAVEGASGATDPQILIVGGTRLKIEAVPTYPYVRFTPIPGPTDSAVSLKSGLDKNAAVALIGGNQGGAGQSTTIGDPTTNPTSPPPTDPMNPTTPAKPGVQGINEMETPKGDIYDTSHPGWRNRTKQWIDTIQRSLDAGFFPEAYASQMRQYLEQLKLSVINGKPMEEIEDQYSSEDVERNINEYRRKMGFKLLPKGWWDVQNQIISELETQSKDPNPTISERAKKDLEEVMSYRSRWRVDHLTEKRIFQNLYKEAPQDAGLFDDPEALDLPESKDPVFKYALKPADGSLFVSFRPDSFEAVKTDFKNIDLWKEKFPDSIGQWDESMAAIFQPHDKVFGRKNIPAGEHSYVPIAPAKLLEYIQNPSVLGHALTLVSADMRDAATNGLMHMKMTRGLYDQGKITAGETGEYIAWGMLSKRLTPYYQEAGFMILRENGLRNWIQGAADGEFSEADLNKYYDWVEQTLKGTPGASAIANAKAFGRDFLLKGAQVLREGPYAGKTAIQAIHEIVANPSLSGPQMRRLIGEINYPLRLGFDNKITSFFLQLTGKTDVMVLDRVQFNHFWNSTELAPQLGIKTKKGSATANLYDNTNLASIANGPRGIAVYEAMESALSQPVLDAYRRLGIEDGNLSRFHWETWSLHSGQATDHSTLNLITNDLLGLPNNGIGAKQGKFDTWGSQSTFGYGKGGMFGKFTWNLSDGTSIELDSEQQQRLIEELRRQQEGRGRSQYVVVPKGFKLANLDENGAKIPWFQAKNVNRQNLDMLIRSVAK